MLPEAVLPGVSVDVVVGDPFAAILEALRSLRADLAVIGGPGKRGLKELFTGTTAERVIRFADQPVLTSGLSPGSIKATLASR